MKWSWRIGRFAGIDVFMHWTFLLLLVWIGAFYVMQGETIGTAIRGILVILSFFLCVVLHEYGHALTARRYGVGTRDITLLPIGGVARLESIPRDPWQEFWIAIAGPLVNVAIAAVLLVVLAAQNRLGQSVTARSLTDMPFMPTLLWFNTVVVLFNLLPAFPMDGGRILRAILAARMDYVRATRTAANVGQMMAILFGIVGLFYNPFLLFIALFVYLGAEAEAQTVEITAATDDVSVREAMMTYFRSLSPDDSLQDAAHELLAGSQQDFPVVDQGHVVGMLCRADLIRGFSQDGADVQVRELMQTEFITAQVGEMLETVLPRMKQAACSTVPVVDQQQVLVGLLSLENIGELIMLRSAARSRLASPQHVEQMLHAN